MIPSGEIPIPQEVSEQKFTYEEVEGLLAEFNQKGIFGTLRAEQQELRTFFDSKQGYIAEDDESPTGTVLDMYKDALQEENPVTIRSSERERKNMIDVLEPGSRERAVLLAYYQISEETPWAEASGAICSRQIHKSESFPQSGVVGILEKLEGSVTQPEIFNSTREKLLEDLNLEVRKDPQTGWEFGGYITVRGPLESVRKVLLAMTELGGYDEDSGWKRVSQIALRKSLENRINMDLDILGENGKKKMVRIISFSVKPDGSIEISLGGGGNRTKFSEMETVFENAVAKAAEQET